MNCFAHALPYLDDPFRAVGACIPDWLSACDRKCRTRSPAAQEFFESADSGIRALAKGIVQHHHDDRWFHQTDCFQGLNLQFAVEVQSRLQGENGFRPGLLGHIVIEMLLDAYLETRYPGRLEAFYQLVAEIDPAEIETRVNQIATRPTNALQKFIPRFLEARYLFDYQDDERMLFRLNQVLRRVGLEPVGSELDAWFPGARAVVYERVDQLLVGYPWDSLPGDAASAGPNFE